MPPGNGMTPEDRWVQTDVHKASRYYCGKCGKQFDGPHALYDHLDTEHPRGDTPRDKRRRKPK